MRHSFPEAKSFPSKPRKKVAPVHPPPPPRSAALRLQHRPRWHLGSWNIKPSDLTSASGRWPD